MQERYLRNIPSVSEAEQAALAQKRVLVAGCGGLGGYLIEYLARMGVGTITAVDGDRFAESNLNRQLLATAETLGQHKAAAAKKRAAQVNPQVNVLAVDTFLDAENADGLLQGQDLILDALDSVSARLLLEDVCARRGVPLVHGAIHGWTVQAAVSLPGSGLLHRLYGGATVQSDKASLPFTPPFCAAIQAAEAVRLLCGWPSPLAGRVLVADLRTLDRELLEL